MKKNFLIIHYNTPLLTECLVKSINKFVDNAIIYILDNSTSSPFKSHFSNVILMDNTKGQLIDFDKWLSMYPNRKLSKEGTKCFGSAKHCYSVEKCMDFIGEPFILLDSDVLLKKDVSELFDDNMMYVGDIDPGAVHRIKRVYPFICYINTPICKENNVHFFNENYMHGLMKTDSNSESNKYDTGAYFYLAAEEYEHRRINYMEYVVHYGHGSWNKLGVRKNIPKEEWLSVNRKYWDIEGNKNVVYTCITGGYDSLKEPLKVSEGFDYICYTDNSGTTSQVWDIRPLPEETDALTDVKKQRYVKINAHKLLGEYDLSVWVDGNITLKDDLNDFIEQYIKGFEASVFVPTHPQRDCIYKEAEAVVRMRKDTSENVNGQVERYKSEGYPSDNGLLQSNIMVRYHNRPDCVKLMEEWFCEVLEGSHRDQLSFNYVSWKNSNIPVIYIDKDIYDSKWFKWVGKHNRTIVKKEPSQKYTDILKKIREKRIAIQTKYDMAIKEFNSY